MKGEEVKKTREKFERLPIFFCAKKGYRVMRHVLFALCVTNVCAAALTPPTLGDVAWKNSEVVMSGDDCYINMPDGSVGSVFGHTKDGR